MTAYKELFGKYVQNVTSDPTSTDAEGQIWYNSTSGTFKTALGGYGAWSAGGNLNTARTSLAGAGTQTAALAFGGNINAPVYGITNTELYNGTSWTNNPTGLGTARYALAGAGLQTAAIAFGGVNPPIGYVGTTESWNGSTWSPATSMSTGRTASGTGLQTAALAFGGYGPANFSSSTESWNGSSWTTLNSMNTARYGLAGAGTQTAALAFGGASTVVYANTESWNGTSWTNVNSLNTGRYTLAGNGTQTAALAFGGNAPTLTGATELWNGTSWTNSPTSLATARTQLASAISGTQTASLAIGGVTTVVSAATESWTQSVTVPVAGSWSSGGNLNTARYGLVSAGIQTAALAFGGVNPTTTGVTELYNGTSWTSNPTGLNTARGFSGGAGTQTAALAFGGTTVLSATEKWNGTAWTNNPTGLNTARQELAGCGLQTAALAVNGVSSPGGTRTAASESFNGTSWTNTPSLNTPNYARTLFGTNTAAICAGGADSPSAATESWNGSSWTTLSATLNTARSFYTQSAGIQTAGLVFGGENVSSIRQSATESWNGTSWTTMNSLATARNYGTGCGTQTSALMIGGSTGSATGATEAWTGPSTTLNYKTLTTS